MIFRSLLMWKITSIISLLLHFAINYTILEILKLDGIGYLRDALNFWFAVHWLGKLNFQSMNDLDSSSINSSGPF